MLIGLQYVGNANGITIMLYKSYKTVTVTWDKAYKFTNRDNISENARKYYLKNYMPLGLRLIEDKDLIKEETNSEQLNSPNEDQVVEYSQPSGEIISEEIESFSEDKKVVEEINSEETEDSATEEPSSYDNSSLNSIVESIVKEYGRDVLESASVSDLGEILDSRMTTDQIKELSKEIGYNYGKTRNKYKIINAMLESNLQEVITFLLKR